VQGGCSKIFEGSCAKEQCSIDRVKPNCTS